MTSRTRFIIEHVERVIAAETREPDSQVITELIQRALSDGGGFQFIQQQRPDPAYYKKLLRLNAQQRAELIAKKGKESRLLRIALEDLQEVLGDFEGPGMQSGDFGTPGKKSRLAARLEVLNLCLEVVPQARRRTIEVILSKHLGAAPLHMRNPVDAVYAFTFSSRDAGAEGFGTLDQQRAFIDRQLRLIDELCAPGDQDSEKLSSFEAAAAMEPGAFAEWYLGALEDRSLLRLSMNEPKKGEEGEEGEEDDAQTETGLHRAAVELLTAEPERRDELISRKRKTRKDYALAHKLMREIIGEDYRASVEKTSLRFRVRPSMEMKKEERATALRQRRDDLDLVLGVTPALDVDRANRLLTGVLGAPALDAHRAADAVYEYLLRIRPEQLPGLDQQRAFARQLFFSAENEHNWGTPHLPSTQFIAGSLDEIEPGDVDEFEEWLRETIGSMDRVDHHYWARVHFGDSLKRIARGNDAARLTTVTSALLDDLDRSPVAGKAEWNLNEYRTMDADVLKERLYSIIEAKGAMESDGYFISKLLQHATGIAPEPEPVSTTQGQTYLNAMEIMSDGLGLDFYNIWHAIGVQYLLSRKGELPEDFPGRDRWREYYARMTAEGDSLDAALWVRMDDEPEYLAALRRYAKTGALPENCAAQIRAVTEAAKSYEALIGRSAMFYIMSDWHYACIGGEYAPGSNAGAEADNEARRIERVTSRTNRVYGEDRTDVPDVPRGLLILSELARINAAPSGRYTSSQLVRHLNRILSECGYAMLDVRRRLDFMFYCVIRIAEVHAVSDEFSFDHILTGLHEYIRSHIFSDLVTQLLRLYDFDPRLPDGADHI